MKIISVRQPWAGLIVHALKDVENRTWATKYRGPVLIHASGRADNVTDDEIEARFGVRPPTDMTLGGVVGVAEIVDCVRDHPSRWYAPAHWALVLANPRPLPFVRWKGALSIRTAPAELLELLGINASGELRAASENELEAA